MKKDGQKKFVRYKEGAEMYSMSMRKFQDMAKDAGCIGRGRCRAYLRSRRG